MKYVNGTFLKTCNERLREKLLTNLHTGKDYIAYYPVGYEVIGYFNSGSQVNVSTVMQRGTGKKFLLKNEDPRAHGLSGALKREMQVSHLVEKVFEPKHAPNIPKAIEGAYFQEAPARSYLIEEQKQGYQLTLELFNGLSNKKKKFVMTELAKNLGRMHFWIPDRYLRLSDFVVETGVYFPDPVSDYRRKASIAPFFNSEKLALIHCDLAPANIIYDGDTLSIIDYGRAGISSRKEDFQSIRRNYSDEFTIRLMDTYVHVCERFAGKW